MSFDTIIRGARVVTPGGVSNCDIGIEGGVITALGTRLDGAAEVIDATGLIAMPGGIDSHVFRPMMHAFSSPGGAADVTFLKYFMSPAYEERETRSEVGARANERDAGRTHEAERARGAS